MTNPPVTEEAVERAWAPHERNYSGGRVGVWFDTEWTMLRVEAGIGDATISIRDNEAWDLARRLSPKLVERMDWLFAEMKKAQAAVYQFTYAESLAPLLRKIADEWDCDSAECEFAGSDMGGLSCCQMDTERGCRAVEADELRQYAEALETKAALKSPPVVSEEDRRMIENLRFLASKNDGPGGVCRVPQSNIRWAAARIEALAMSVKSEATQGEVG